MAEPLVPKLWRCLQGFASAEMLTFKWHEQGLGFRDRFFTSVPVLGVKLQHFQVGQGSILPGHWQTNKGTRFVLETCPGAVGC